MQTAPLILASASPRRAELLAAAGVAFTVEVADVDETPQPGEQADDYVCRLAASKAHAVRARHPQALILGADTTVVIDGDILGKPASANEAAHMLGRLQGRAHEVLTGVALVHGSGQDVRLARTRVWFAPMTPAEVAGYVATGEPMDKAGAYAIQGAASRWVTRMEGSFANVVGLPVAEVSAMLRARWLTGPGHGAMLSVSSVPGSC